MRRIEGLEHLGPPGSAADPLVRMEAGTLPLWTFCSNTKPDTQF